MLRLAVDGSIDDFVMNDRCAAGSGRFLEVLAGRLAVELPSLGQLARASRKPAGISSMCVVFAETEIVGLLASGIVAGRHRRRGADLGGPPHRRHGGPASAAPIVLTGGVAMIPGMDSALAAALGAEVVVSPDPQLTGGAGRGRAGVAAIGRQRILPRRERGRASYCGRNSCTTVISRTWPLSGSMVRILTWMPRKGTG